MTMIKNSLALALTLTAVTLSATTANAATTVDVKTGTPAETGLNWLINGSAAVTPSNIHLNWYSGGAAAGQNGNVDGARWITPNGDGTLNQPVGTATYSTVFTLSQIATAATLTGNFWSDNRVTQILLNGIAIYNNGSSASQFGGGTGVPLNISTNLLAGANTLSFLVQNDSGTSGPGSNPAGLRVSAVFSAVPEPGTWMLMLLGFGAVGFSMRRRQKTQVRFQFA
ncbi:MULTISPECIES: PEPxxWA-CTERM sorting domain-containing protein [unclassified Sphingopyxis]|uniref:PEPxxWA-CTERM sorting domain-containing protein n=1 Tax=unclassified Sphingopyxis TaxID=2614943 RepID=UPI0024AE31A4|nr:MULTISPECIES: PEPxxWA-CTERM sorting domain-containing protein [unclassified Sphingopyxis]